MTYAFCSAACRLEMRDQLNIRSQFLSVTYHPHELHPSYPDAATWPLCIPARPTRAAGCHAA